MRSNAKSIEISVVHKVLLAGLLLPISLTVGADSSKPMDFLLPDLFVIAALFTMLARAYPRPVHWAIWAFFAVSLLSILYNAMFDGLFAQRLVSFLRLFRSFPLAYVGYDLAMRYPQETIRRFLAKSSLAMVTILLVSDLLFTEGFPVARWGGDFLGAEVYGFPNSPAAFYSVYVLFLVGTLFARHDDGSFRFLYGFAFLIVTSIITMTLSRSGLATLVFLIGLLLLFGIRRKLLVLVLVVICGLVVFYIFSSMPDMFAAFWFKIERTFNSDDFSSGRTEIWENAINLIMQRPVLGFGFESFSNYSDFDTPHNQYLELTYKAGLLGSTVFFMMISCFIWMGLRSKILLYRQFACLLIAWSATAFFQPNFSYTPILSFTMFIAGMIIAGRHNRRGFPDGEASLETPRIFAQ